MSDSAFIPFGLPAGSPATSTVTAPKRWLEVLPATAATAGPGSATPVGSVSAPGSAPAAAPNPVAPCEPKVRLEKDGDRIKQVMIECSCGRLLVLRCDY